MKRFILTVPQKSAEGVLLPKMGGRPERYPARGIKGKASKQRDLRDDRRQKSLYCLAFRRQVGVKPRGASRQGPNRLLATHSAASLAMHTSLNPPNRRMRTRMYGGEGGEDRRLSPLSRLSEAASTPARALLRWPPSPAPQPQ